MHRYYTRAVAKKLKAEGGDQGSLESKPPPQGDPRKEKLLALLNDILEIYPDAGRISITTSDISRGVHVRWSHANDTPGGRAIEVLHDAPSSLLDEESLSSSPHSVQGEVSLISNPTLDTPCSNDTCEPSVMARTPKKLVSRRAGRPLQRAPNHPVNWNVIHNPEEHRRRQVAPQDHPRGRHPLRRAESIIEDEPHRIIIREDEDVLSEEEAQRKRDIEDLNVHDKEMVKLRDQSRIQQRALKAAQEAGLFDEDAEGNNDYETGVGPTLPDADFTSEVFVELPSSYPREAAARFYRDQTGRWRLEGALETEALALICRNCEEMMGESAFKQNCKEWGHLQRGAIADSAIMARVTAPLSEEDALAMMRRTPTPEDADQLLPLSVYDAFQHLDEAVSNIDTGSLEQRAGPSRLSREATELIEGGEESWTAVSFPIGKRIQ